MTGRIVAKHASVYAIATLAQAGSSLLAVPLVALQLTPAEFGRLSLLLVVAFLVGSVCHLGLTFSMSRVLHEPSGLERSRNYAGAGTGAALCVAAVGVVTGISVVLAGAGVGEEVIVVATVGPMIALCQIGLAASRTAGDPRSFVRISLTYGPGSQAAGLMIVLLKPSAEWFFVGYSGPLLAATALALGASRPRWPKVNHDLLEAMKMSALVIPHSLSAYLLAAGDRIIIGSVTSASAVGQYQLAYVLGSAGIVAAGPVNNAWVPQLMSKAERDRAAFLTSVGRVTNDLFGAIGVALVLSAPLLAQFFVPSGYGRQQIALTLSVVAVSTVIYSYYLISVAAVFSVGQTRGLAVITPVSVLLNFAMVYVLTPMWGIEGAAVGTVCAYAVQAVLTARYGRRLAGPVALGVSGPAIAWLAGAAICIPLQELGDPKLRYAATTVAAATALSLLTLRLCSQFFRRSKGKP